MTDAKDVHDTLKAISFMVKWSPHGVQVITTDALKDILNHIDTLTRERDAARDDAKRLAAVREAASLVCETAVEVQGMSYCEVYTTHVDALCAAVSLTQGDA
jgi:hypothetical protein